MRSELARYLENDGRMDRRLADQTASNLLRRGRSHAVTMLTNIGATGQAEDDALAMMPPRPPGPIKRYTMKGFDWWSRFLEERSH